MRGSKKKFTEKEIKEIEKLASLGLTIDNIGFLLDTPSRTLYSEKKRSKEVADAIKRGRETANSKVANALFKCAVNGNITACIFWLKCRGGENWKEKVEVTDQGKDGMTFVIRSSNVSTIAPKPADA